MPDQPLRKKKIATGKVPPKRYYIIQEELENLPIKEVYPSLIEKLSVDPKDVGMKELKPLIFSCPDDARLAGYIFAIAKSDLERIKDEFDVKMGDWIEEAKSDIGGLKKDGEWPGSTSKEDVQRFIAKENEEYLEFKTRIRKATLVVDSLKAFYEAWKTRLSSLQTYAKVEHGRSKSFEEFSASLDEKEK
jgi:hypothetical protein